MKIAVVGPGDRGLPFALQFCGSGVEVPGLDIDPANVAALGGGKSCFRHLPTAALSADPWPT